MSSETRYSVDELRAIFEMLGTYGIAILEMSGLKIVKAPDSAPTLERGHEVSLPPRTLHDDPMLYSDGDVPSFARG